jgi:hypothetical protein
MRTNASYAIMYGFDANPAWLQARQQRLDAFLQQGLPNSSRQVTTETLNVMGLGWMVQTELAHELLSQEWGQLSERGLVGSVGGGRYIADNASPAPSTVPYSMNPFTADYVSTPTAPNGYGFQRDSNLPFTTDFWNFLGTGPTPSSGGGSAMLTGSGASLFFLPSENSSTGK